LLRITVIQRESNRKFLSLNATVAEMHTLLRNVAEKSFTIRVVQFEGMTVDDQAAAVSETDVLIGADGTGIMNGIFLPENHRSCVITVLPYGVPELIPWKGENFASMFAKLGVGYHSIESSPVHNSLETYQLAAAKKDPIERWFMLKQDLNVSSLQLVSAIIQSCRLAQNNSTETRVE